ncbi:MAG: TetR/AcrR family transcriptional regulator [Thermoleophilia bacterium]
MPKVVDHAARREEIVDALLRVAERDGLDGVSLRAVAREGGWSTGVLAHYFPAKDDLLAFALARAGRRPLARGSDAAARARTPLLGLRALLREALPVTDDGRREARLWFGLTAGGAGVAGAARDRDAAWTDALAGALRAAGLAPDDARRGAIALLATADGLALRMLTASLSRRAADRALDDALAAVAGRG